MKISPKIFFATIFFCLGSSLNATIIFLKGTGSSGKTSLCKALVSIDPSWKVVDEDELFINKIIDHIRDKFPHEFGAIENAVALENLFHAVKYNQILFKDIATLQNKTDAEIAIYNIKKKLDQFTLNNEFLNGEWFKQLRLDILAHVKNYANAGFNVVVDSCFLKSKQIDELKQEYKTVSVLTYSPIKKLVNRTITRNYRALLNRDLYSMRYFHQALTSFIGIYDFQENWSEQSIDVIKREEINNVLDVVGISLAGQAQTSGSLSPFSREEFSRSQLHEYRSSFMKKFLNTDVLYVTPKDNVDFVMRTAEMSSDESASQLLVMVESVSGC